MCAAWPSMAEDYHSSDRTVCVVTRVECGPDHTDRDRRTMHVITRNGKRTDRIPLTDEMFTSMHTLLAHDAPAPIVQWTLTLQLVLRRPTLTDRDALDIIDAYNRRLVRECSGDRQTIDVLVGDGPLQTLPGPNGTSSA